MQYKDKFKFCPECGEKAGLKGRLIRCASCNFTYYIPPSVCNALMLYNDKNEILLIERKLDPFAGWYDTAGGFVEFGENIEESIQREIQEELSIKINIEDMWYVGSCTDVYEYEGLHYNTLGIVFASKVENVKIEAHDDVKSYKFFSKDEIPYDKLAFTSGRKTILDFFQILESHKFD